MIAAASAVQARAQVVSAVADLAAAESPDAVSEVVVTGAHTSTTVQGALDEKRKDIAVTAIMSADEIAQRPGGNIADIISHMPGLTAYADMGLGQAATGEAEYVSIRGLDSSYNAYTLNGIRVPQGDPGSRALSLKMVAPFGLQAVKVTETPTADMDGDSIGGVIDIRTPTAFDFAGPMNRITVEGNFSELASNLGSASAGADAQFEAARRFGEAGNIGLYVTGYYGRKNTSAESVEAVGYTPSLAADATATDYRNTPLSATGVKYDFYRDEITRYGGNFSLDYKSQNQTWYVQGSYANYSVKGDDTQHSIINGLISFYGDGPNYSPVGILPGSYFQERDQIEQMVTAKVGGSSNFGRLSADYSLSYGFSEVARPNYVEASLYGPYSATGSATNINLTDPAHTQVSYDSAATKAYVLNQNSDALWKYQGSDSASYDTMYTGKADFTYSVKQGLLDTVQFGADVNVANRTQYQHQFYGNNGDNFVILGPGGVVEPFDNPAGPVSSALSGRDLTSFLGGSYAGVFRVYNRSNFAPDLASKYTSQYGLDADGNVVGNPGAYTLNDYERNTVTGTEAIGAGYVEANFVYNDLRATAGLRYEDTDFSSRVWVVNGDAGGFQRNSHNYGEVLPNLLVTYRPDPSMVFRAGVRESFSRPAFGLIASPINYSFNSLTGALAGISQGNPNLKPTTAINYDASAEFYGPNASIFEVNLYYKSIHDYIYSATTSGSTPSANTASALNGAVLTSEPENGGDASLMGMVVNARRRLSELPGLWNGFGVGGSVTLQHSSADSLRADHYGRKTWLPHAPEELYNLDLFFDKYGVKADLSYQYTGLQLVGLTGDDLDEYIQPISTLDFSVSYPIYGVVVTASAKNLLDTVQYYKTLGKTTQYLGYQDAGGNGSYVETGRFMTVSASYKF